MNEICSSAFFPCWIGLLLTHGTNVKNHGGFRPIIPVIMVRIINYFVLTLS